MAIQSNNFGFNAYQMMNFKSNSTANIANSKVNQNVQPEPKPAAREVSDVDFRLNYDKQEYRGKWIYYVQPNGVAHAIYVNKKGRVTKVFFGSPEDARRL